jgi:hypothetical protein
MKNFEVPLYLIANEQRELKTDTITQAHRIYLGLDEDEYREEAPDSQAPTAAYFFAKLEGPTWEERREQININHQMRQLPKCLDIPLVFASDGDIDRARWLVEEIIDQGILHEPISQHREFFEQIDVQEEAFEQIAEAEAEKRRVAIMRNLRRDD